MIEKWPWNIKFSTLDGDDLFDHFEYCLMSHDWTYFFSDDPIVYERGTYEERYLNALRNKCETVDKQCADELFFHHSHWHNDDGTRRTL